MNMDEQKLLDWIKDYSEEINLGDCSIHMTHTSDLVSAIQNGVFDTELCDMCNEASELKYYKKVKGYVYCPYCGRKLEEV